MKIRFLGTRASIDVSNRRHRQNSSLWIEHASTRLRIDCGEDWLGRANEGHPDAIILTHAHYDHAYGLRDGSPCPVYATEDTWKTIDDFPINDRKTLSTKRKLTFGGVEIRAFPVDHSINCPAVGLKIKAEQDVLFYVPDVVYIPQMEQALAGIELYIGDGSSITRSLVRMQGQALVGHTTIRAQIGWCAQHHVRKAIFTHCGTGIVNGDERTLGAQVCRLGRESGVDARLAYDGLEIRLF